MLRRRDRERRHEARDILLDGHLTREDLARLLHIPKRRIERWERRHLIPRLVPPCPPLSLFPRSAVLAWLARIRLNEDAGVLEVHGSDQAGAGGRVVLDTSGLASAGGEHAVRLAQETRNP